MKAELRLATEAQNTLYNMQSQCMILKGKNILMAMFNSAKLRESKRLTFHQTSQESPAGFL